MAEKRVFGNDGPGHPDLPMSTFDKTYTNNLTARVGRAYPCFVDLVPPHSTAHITPHAAFDMMPTVSPIQASIHCHISYYKIPLRILMRSYEDFFLVSVITRCLSSSVRKVGVRLVLLPIILVSLLRRSARFVFNLHSILAVVVISRLVLCLVIIFLRVCF